MTKPLISIITPVYNAQHYLELLIQGIIDETQTLINPNEQIEHIIINDGSTDDGYTKEIISKFDHIRYIEHENKGQYFCMNEGLQAAKGDWVCFISADDLISSGTFTILLKTINAFPKQDGFWGKSRFIDSNGKDKDFQPVHQKSISTYKYFTHIPHCSTYINREFLINNNLSFDSRLKFHGDYDWFLRVLLCKPKMKFINHEFSQVRIHPQQTTITKWNQIKTERKKVHKVSKVNPVLYRTIQFYLKLNFAIQQIVTKTRADGIIAGFGMIKYFLFRRLRIIKKTRIT